MWKNLMASRAGAAMLAIFTGALLNLNLPAADAPPGTVDQLKFGGQLSEEEANFTRYIGLSLQRQISIQ